MHVCVQESTHINREQTVCAKKRGMMTLQQEQPSCSNKKTLWKLEEDMILKKYVETHGEGNWETVSKRSGLNRGGKSCRLRWKNYLRPNIKRGNMSQEEQDLIIRMHKLLGNRWSLIAGRLPGRTDNEVKNYWNTHLNKNKDTSGAIPAPPAGGRKRKSNDHEHLQDNCHYGNKYSKIISTTESARIRNNGSEEKSNKIGSWNESDSVMSTVAATNHPYLLCDSSSSTVESLNFDYVDVDPPSSSWIQYYLSTMADNNARSLSSSRFVLDDESFIAYMDSFLLLEAAFGCNSAAAASTERECNHQL